MVKIVNFMFCIFYHERKGGGERGKLRWGLHCRGKVWSGRVRWQVEMRMELRKTGWSSTQKFSCIDVQGRYIENVSKLRRGSSHFGPLLYGNLGGSKKKKKQKTKSSKLLI